MVTHLLDIPPEVVAIAVGIWFAKKAKDLSKNSFLWFIVGAASYLVGHYGARAVLWEMVSTNRIRISDGFFGRDQIAALRVVFIVLSIICGLVASIVVRMLVLEKGIALRRVNINWIKRLFSKSDETNTTHSARNTEDKGPTSAPSTEIPWDYIRKVSSDNDTFFNDHKASFPSIYTRIKGKGRDPILMLVAFEQEKWCALLALLYKRPQNLLFTPESMTKGKPTISNNAYCDVYTAPCVNGQTMQAGVYGLEREWLISELCWIKGIPPMFIKLIKSEMQPSGTFTVVNLAAGGMNVQHLPVP